MKPRVLIIHNSLGADSSTDELDVVEQRDAISASLDRLGYSSSSLALTLDLAQGAAAIRSLQPFCIVNLVESLDGNDRLLAAAPLLYESLGIPFTGSPSAALAATSNKCFAKRIMHGCGIPTPQWRILEKDFNPPQFFPCIIKSSTNHASIGISDDSIVTESDDWHCRVNSILRSSNTEIFAEEYIPGREFNCSIIEQEKGEPLVLTPAEISFEGYPKERPHIVGYSAKWDKTSIEYNHTVRRFSDDPQDASLLATLSDISRLCWELFSLKGCCRVDFRINSAGKPFVLEINANPCLSPDAGFVAACIHHGIDFDAMVNMLLKGAISSAARQAGQ